MDSDTPELTKPRIYMASDDVLAQKRIETLDREIQGDPNRYMLAAISVGHLSVAHAFETELPLPTDELETARRERRMNAARTRLGALLTTGDTRYIEFDSGSDDAVYSNPETVRYIKDIQAYRVPAEYTADNDPELNKLKDHLSMFKIFLYAKRVKAWKEQQQNVPEQKKSKADLQTTA